MELTDIEWLMLTNGLRSMRTDALNRPRNTSWKAEAVPHLLQDKHVFLWNPMGDGNCLYWCLLQFLGVECTVENCRSIRTAINQFIMGQPQGASIIPYETLEQSIRGNLEGVDQSTNEERLKLQYARTMASANPFRCNWGTTLEACAFGKAFNVTTRIYRRRVTQYEEIQYELMAVLHDAGDDFPVMCLLFENHGHFQLMDPTTVYEEMKNYQTQHTQSQQERVRNMAEEEREELRHKHAQSERDYMARKTEEEREEVRRRNAASHQERVRNMAEEEREELRHNHAQSERANLARKTEEEREEVRRRNAASHQQQKAKRRCAAETDDFGAAASCNLDTYNPENNSFGDGGPIHPVNIGEYGCVCMYCHAIGYNTENRATKKGDVHFGILCCNQGKVELEPIPTLHDPGEIDMSRHNTNNYAKRTKRAWDNLTDEQKEAANELYHLFVDKTKEAKYFQSNIRKLNAGMSMASLSVTDKTERGRGPPGAFKVSGVLYRRIGPILPSNNQDNKAKFLQIYFLDPKFQAKVRASKFQNDPETNQSIKQMEIHLFSKLQRILTTIGNRYLDSFLSVNEYIRQQHLDPDDLEIELHPCEEQRQGDNAKAHPGRLNLPTAPTVSILLPTAPRPVDKQIIVCQMRQSKTGQNDLQFINNGHCSSFPLIYPLLNPLGVDGFHWNMKSLSNAAPNEKISVNKYTRYHIMERDRDETHILHRGGALFQQFLVDHRARADSERVAYVGGNQARLRGNTLSEVKGNLKAGNIEKSGRQTLMPSSVTGSDRWYNKKYENAMAIVSDKGKPHLFLTFTFDVNCEEMQEHLLEGQSPYDRPDMIARIFQLKLKSLFDDITKKKIFGEVGAILYSVEWQKRGAPHAHILIWLKHFDEYPHTVDGMISAEIPPLRSALFELVDKNMLHRCGPSCDEDGKCKRDYPRQYSDRTEIGDGAFVKYRRRSPKEGGRFYSKRYGGQYVQISNQNVVPYSPYLLLKYKCHVNLECCATIKSVKYIIHYPLKGADLMTIEKVDHDDEIKGYETKRFISSCQAATDLFEFRRVVLEPSVRQLDLHLPEEQYITYKPNKEDAVKATKSIQVRTNLVAYFELNELALQPNADPDIAVAATLLYEDIPKKFAWQQKEHMWSPRSNRSKPQIGRIPTISPQPNEELFYLRMLLQNKRGATSFEDLRTVNGTEYATFKLACIEMDLLQDDTQLMKCMEEAALFKVPYALRNLFCCILSTCEIKDTMEFLNRFKVDMMEDFLFSRRNEHMEMSDEDMEKFAYNDMLQALNEFFEQVGQSNSSMNLPIPEVFDQNVTDNATEFDPNAGQYFRDNRPKLNTGQDNAFRTIQQRLDASLGGVIYIDAPAGTGKTFLANTLLAYIRKDFNVAIACATTGIAAIILHLGTTAHRRFKFPIPCIKGSTSFLKFDSKESNIIKEAKLIIIDEVSCMSGFEFECLDQYLKELMGNDTIMGGKLVVLVGDFRQGLPVVLHGNRAQIVATTIKHCESLWNQVTVLHLTQNMRVERLINNNMSPQRADELRNHAEWLLSIGNGTVRTHKKNIVEIPQHMVCESPMDLEEKVYNDFHQNGNYMNRSYLKERAILSTRNDTIQEANFNMVRDKLDGDLIVSTSVDECVDDKDKKNFDSKILNKISAPGFPPHRLALKKNACVILIRNLNVKRRHCNGTRCIITDVQPHVLRATLLDPPETEIFIPKIPLICDNPDFPAKFRRTQFPILGAYYLTFNRAQGQSLGRVGMLLPQSVFTHGQLYTGYSRSGDNKTTFVWANQAEFEQLKDEGELDATKTYTRNIVYEEILDRGNDNDTDTDTAT